jgi:hypothetical protein
MADIISLANAFRIETHFPKVPNPPIETSKTSETVKTSKASTLGQAIREILEKDKMPQFDEHDPAASLEHLEAFVAAKQRESDDESNGAWGEL